MKLTQTDTAALLPSNVEAKVANNMLCHKYKRRGELTAPPSSSLLSFEFPSISARLFSIASLASSLPGGIDWSHFAEQGPGRGGGGGEGR